MHRSAQPALPPAAAAMVKKTALALCLAALSIYTVLRHRRRRRALQATIEPPLLVMSFGSACLTARSLGVAGARAFAAPFDWIFSNPKVVAHVISTRGAALLDTDQYFKAPRDTAGFCHHTYSPMLLTSSPRKKSKHSSGVFMTHHDPTQDRAYWQRVVARLNTALDSPLPKLCALVSLERRGAVSDDDLEELHGALERHSNPSSPVTLVVIKLTTQAATASQDGCGLGAARCWERRLGHVAMRVVELRSRGGLDRDATRLLDPEDQHDLLVAIFGAAAAFEQVEAFDASGARCSKEVLTHPRLSPDPIRSSWSCSSAAETHAEEVLPESTRRLWHMQHRGVHAKYVDDRYMVDSRAERTHS
jgi:hypothetical protein